jgi:hypothetical protein
MLWKHFADFNIVSLIFWFKFKLGDKWSGAMIQKVSAVHQHGYSRSFFNKKENNFPRNWNELFSINILFQSIMNRVNTITNLVLRINNRLLLSDKVSFDSEFLEFVIISWVKNYHVNLKCGVTSPCLQTSYKFRFRSQCSQ